MASSLNPVKVESENLAPKNRPLEALPEPQPRYPSVEHYRSIIGPKPKIVFKLPKNNRPYWPPIKRKPNSHSQYDDRSWPESAHQINEQMNKRLSQERFLLNDNEMGDLAYVVGPRRGNYQDHMYLTVEAERRAWEIYGGPEGFQFARDEHDRKARSKKPRQRRPRSETTPRYAPYPVRFDPVLALVGNICLSCD